jgi:hypothetical protein
MGPVGRLILQFPANYGFTAIIARSSGVSIRSAVLAITSPSLSWAKWQITIKLLPAVASSRR